MEAHNGLSAKIVEEAGFEGIWASGLTVSASFGVRDNNELSWTQITDNVASMADCTSIPILLDGDTGHGNFNNMRRFVRKLEQAGVAGVTIEDKQFPKVNSFIRSEGQALADMDEFCGKIKAGKDCLEDPDFVIIARTEALIAGRGMAEALRRAEAYRKAGADAILIHSKHSTPSEVFTFIDEWAGRLPVVLVPTKYYTTPTEDFRERKVSIVIWANHLLRSALTAMQQTARIIHEEQTLINVEPQVASLDEVFRLQGDEELRKAEEQYMPVVAQTSLNGLILAAGASKDFAELTAKIPKVMLQVRGKPILSRLLEDFRYFGCHSATIVRGEHATALDSVDARFVENADFASTGEAYSLSLAEGELSSSTFVSFGDIVIKRYVLHSLLEEAGDGITLLVDSKMAGQECPDRVSCDHAYTGHFSFDPVHLKEISDSMDLKKSHGVWIGTMHLGAQGSMWMKEAIAESRADGSLRKARIGHLITRILAKGHPIRVAYVHGGWINVNTTTDLINAAAL